MSDGKWWKVADAATYAKVNQDTVYSACARGLLRHVRLEGRRSIRLRPEWVDEWLNRFERAASDR